MNRVFLDGLLGTGCTIAARLLDFEFDAVLTNEPMPSGLARWWEVRPGSEVMPPRVVVVPVGAKFPYGQNVEAP